MKQKWNERSQNQIKKQDVVIYFQEVSKLFKFEEEEEEENNFIWNLL